MFQDRIVLPTCEVSMDPETAIELGASWGIRHFELKTLWEDVRVPFITDKQKDHLKGVLRNYGADVIALSPGLFIGTEPREDLAAQEVREKLPRSLDLARELGARVLIIFSFVKSAGVGEEWVIDQLARAAEAAKGSGLMLVIEPLEGNYCDSGQALGRIVRGVNSDILRVNWDAANIHRAGYTPYPDEYQHVRGLVAYVHLKNHIADGKKWAFFDQGEVDLRAQLRDLKRDGYAGYLTIETHTRYRKDFMPVIAASKHNYDVLTRWLAEGL